MNEIFFEVHEDDVDGGFIASALGHGIHTEAETMDELKERIRDAVVCHFEDANERPHIIRLHFVRDEVLMT